MDYQILPADMYKVINKTILTELDKKNLITFYSPIIGSLAINLYLLLWQDLENKDDSIVYNHHHLMSILKCSNSSLMNARFSLEATGLIKTFVKEENVRKYIYELYSPLEAYEFINHPILNVVLYNMIGMDEYKNIVKKFEKKRYDLSSYTEITKKMDEVYKSEPFSNIYEIKEREKAVVTIESKIDYDLMLSMIPKNEISPKALNKKMRELIDNMSFIYDVDTNKMVEYIRHSINEFGMIDKEAFKDTVRKNYGLKNNSLPTIVYRRQPEYLKKAEGDTSKRGQIIAIFENMSPYDFLKNKNKGVNPTAKDLKLIEDLLLEIGLTPAVVNVLIDYVLKINNNKLTPNFVTTIAMQWKREDIKTADEAMKFAEKEYKKRTKTVTNAKEKEKNTPVWFNKTIEKEEASEEEQSELAELLKEFN